MLSDMAMNSQLQSIFLGIDGLRNQALSQVCAFHSPFSVSMSDIEIYQLLLGRRGSWG
jgi:hypothetical protein